MQHGPYVQAQLKTQQLSPLEEGRKNRLRWIYLSLALLHPFRMILRILRVVKTPMEAFLGGEDPCGSLAGWWDLGRSWQLITKKVC